jgi:opacity protein-like surface antigen
MRHIVALMLTAIVGATVPAAAQDKKVDVNIGAGYTFALSEVRKHLGDGYNVNVGVTFHVSPVIGIQAEYAFNGLGKKQIPVDVLGPAADETFFGDMNMQYGDFNLLLKPPSQGKAKPYVLAGIGVYYRPVKVTTPAVGYVPGWCDPYWYICYPGGLVAVDQVIGSRSSTDFGINIGAGVNLLVSESAQLYVEARYHYIWGPEVKDQAGVSHGKANGQFLPITFGVRF